MQGIRTWLIGAVAGVALIASQAAAQPATTVGAVLDRGGKKLTATEMKQLVSGATGTQGGDFPNPTFKNVHSANGTVKGDAWSKGNWFSRISGKWTVNDAGQLCLDLVNDQGSKIVGCSTYYLVGDTYYASRTDDRSAEANVRKFSH